MRRAPRRVPLLGLMIVVVAATPAPAAAQERARTWVGLGYGAGGARGGSEAAALMGELVHQNGAHHLAARAVVIVDPFGEGSDSFSELGALYGRVAKGKTGHAALATGLAFTSVAPCDSGASAGCTTLGVPIVAEAAFRPTRVLGIGIQGFANLNRQKVFGGVVMFLQIGWMP